MPQKKTRAKRSTEAGTSEVLKPEISSSTLPDAVVAHMLSDEEIARRAYALWESRGRPFGTPEEDWYRAMQELYASVGSAQK